MSKLQELIDQEKWIEKHGAQNIEFSHLLDIFRDERKLIKDAIAEMQKREGMLVDAIEKAIAHMGAK